MLATVLRITGLTAVYLLFLASAAPGDVLVGAGLSTLLVLAAARARHRDTARPPGTTPWSRLAGVPALIGVTVADICRGTWTVALHCLGLRPTAPGVVTVPIRPGSPASAAAWAIRVGISPDSVVVDVDSERGVLTLHVLDARDPDAVRHAQNASYQRAQRRVFP